MRIDRVILENICQHRSLDIDLDPGLNVIVGPNGCGKTSLVGSICGAITNDWGHFHGVKKDRISQFSSPEDKSFVELRLSHRNASAVLKRGIRPSNHLLVTGSTKLSREADVNDLLENWCGLPLRLVGEYLFVAQGRMYSFLRDSPSRRIEMLNRLFGLDKAERCYQAVTKRLVSFPVIPLYDVRGCEKRLETEERALDEDIVALGSVPPIPEDEELARWNVVLDSRRALQDLEDSLSDSRNRVSKYSAELSKLNDDALELEKEESQEETIDLDRFQSLEADFQAYERYRSSSLVALSQTWLKNREALLTEQATIVDLLQSIASVCDLTAMERQELDSATARLDLIEQTIKSASAQNGPTCSLCGSLLDDRLEQLFQLKWSLMGRRDLLSKQNNDATKRQGLEQRLSTVTRSLEQLDKNLAELGQSAPRALTEEELTQRRIWSEIKNRSTIRQGKIAKIREKMVLASQLAGSAFSQSRQLLGKVETARLVVDSIPDVEDRLRRAEQSRIQKAVLESRILERVERVDRLRKELTEIKEHANRSKATLRWRSELESLKQVFHYDSIPRATAQKGLARMEESLNQWLDRLDVPFRCRVVEPLSFQVSFPDGRNIPAEWLSGGEMVSFSWAWRLAVNTEFASEIGVLCLDEPTDGLDADRLAALGRTISRIREVSNSCGLQFIMVTHERSLLSLFDKVIQIKQPA